MILSTRAFRGDGICNGRCPTAPSSSCSAAASATRRAPGPFGHVRLGTRHRYDRKALDAHLDRMAGLESPAEPNVNKSDAELARFIADHPDVARGP